MIRLERERTENSSDVLWLRVDTNGQQNARPHFQKGRSVAIHMHSFMIKEVFSNKAEKFILTALFQCN